MFKCKIQNKNLLYDAYINKKMSTTEIAKNSIDIFGFKICSASIYNTLILYKIPIRDKSSSVSIAMSTLNINKSFLNEKIIEWIDGFLLGDGSIGHRKKDYMGARFSFASLEKQWSEFAMLEFKNYEPSKPKIYFNNSLKYNCIYHTWNTQTKTHPDISSQAKRWYPNGVKKVPEDVRITPTSLLLWYLGDGSFTYAKRKNIATLRLATCSFKPDNIDNILIPKLNQLGLRCTRLESKNDIKICSDSIKLFFDIIGHKSPISCYDHKFNVPDWLSLKTLKQIIPDRRERWRIIKHIQNRKIEHSKSPGGHYYLFNDEQEKKLLQYSK